MRKLKLIYNPFSGDRQFVFSLDECVSAFQEGGYEVSLFRSMVPGDIRQHIAAMEPDFDAVVVSGGDGTLNLVISSLISRGYNAPVGIIPSGTANDFASFLKIPPYPSDSAKIITAGKTVKCDIGRVNNEYFVNVCGAGMMLGVAQNVPKRAKNLLGKVAYYLKSIEGIPNFLPFSVRITNSSDTIEESVYMLLVLNTSGAGGFNRLVSSASVSDGKLEFVAFKARPLHEIAVLIIKVLSGDFLNDSNVIYFADDKIKIELLSNYEFKIDTDTDGERGPDFPLDVSILPQAVSFFVPGDFQETDQHGSL